MSSFSFYLLLHIKYLANLWLEDISPTVKDILTS